MPFDILKIDRAFVRDVEGMSLGASTLGAIIDIGKSLKLTIIAEGIETAEQARGLERLGCDLLQGFRFFKPMDLAAHAEVLRQHGGDGCRLGWGGAFFSLSFGHGASTSRFDACSMGVAPGT